MEGVCGGGRCIGIEPIYDSVSAARAGLKSGTPTSDASISINNNSDLRFCDFLISNLYAIVRTGFWDKSLILLGWHGFEVRGAHQ